MLCVSDVSPKWDDSEFSSGMAFNEQPHEWGGENKTGKKKGRVLTQSELLLRLPVEEWLVCLLGDRGSGTEWKTEKKGPGPTSSFQVGKQASHVGLFLLCL